MATTFSDAVDKHLKSISISVNDESLKRDGLLMTTTDNGALSYATTTKGRVDCFYGILRGTAQERIEELVNAAWDEDKLHTLKIIAYIRDCRGGKGERTCGRAMLQWLSNKSPEHLSTNLRHYLSTYGRFDDFLALMGTPCEKEALDILAKQLKDDLNNLQGGKPISLAAKWVPSEKKSADKRLQACKKLAKHMKLSPAQLRKIYLSPLRKNLKIVERFMCSNDWESIEFSKVPSCAMRLYGRPNHAFEKHLEERFREWKAGLASGKTKVNAAVLFPHQVVDQYYNKGRDSADDLVEAQWRVMLEKGNELGDLSRTIVMSDVSGSMSGTPMLISVTMGLLVSELAADEFKNLVMTFETTPRFHKVQGDTLYDRVKDLLSAPWGGSTDFNAAIRLILEVAKKHEIEASKMPKRLIVVSDMQFNIATTSNSETNYEALEREYKEAGFEVPHLVFWNVNGSSHDFPATANQKNVSLVSGFSVEILKSVIAGDDITPYSTMLNAISDPRYDLITLAEQTPKTDGGIDDDGVLL